MAAGKPTTQILCLFLIYCSLLLSPCQAAKPKCAISEIDDQKAFKKFIKSRSSILVLFVTDESQLIKASGSFVCDALNVMKGNVDISHVNCGNKGKRLCKQLKVNPTNFLLHHYKDGDFNVNYDRPQVTKSLVAFLKNPTGEAPWSDDPSAASVLHLESKADLAKSLKFQKAPIFIMFYAPWCGHCKRLKPEWASAAISAKSAAVLAAMDVSTDESQAVRMQYNITGFPTLIYFVRGSPLYTYQGEYTENAIVEWVKNPKPFEETPKEDKEADGDWSKSETASNIAFLTDDTFDGFIQANPSVYVMVFAPWCGHCKRMKPQYEDAANELHEKKPEAKLAAVDLTANKGLSSKLNVAGFPTLKYFENGEESYEVDYRTKDDIVSFMMDPKEPPPKPKEVAWDEEESEVVHLEEQSFYSTLKKRKHSLVMFYAPWCGHCKKAKPEFSAAADELKPQLKVMMGAVDCTKYADLCTKYGVSGYPSLKTFTYGKEPKDYNGGRTKDSFVEHLTGLLKSDQASHVEL